MGSGAVATQGLGGRRRGAVRVTYRGPDRRSRQAHNPPQLTLDLLFRQAVLILVAAVIPLAVVFIRGATALGTADAVQVLAGLAAVAAGGALLVCWKIGGRAAPGWLGVALVDLGLLSEAYYSLTVVGLGRLAPVEPYGRLIVCVIVAAAAVSALSSPEVDSGFRPMRTMAVMVLIGVCGLGLLERTLPDSYAGQQSTAVQAATTAACAAVWLAIGAFAAVRQRIRPTFTGKWVGCFALVLAAGAACAALLAASPWRPVINQTGGLFGAAVALVAAGAELRSTVQSQDRYALSLRTVLNDLRAEMQRERTELDDRLHDLRNAVAALRSADSTLRTYADRLDETTRNQLADALSSELSRLQTLIEPGRRVRRERFCLAAALEPVLAAERTRNPALDVRLEAAPVTGDPEGLAQVVQNVLTNARLYAGGTPVSVRSRTLSDRVVLRIADHGPGIPAGERLTVFGRGARGSTSAGTSGSGIGLYVASRLMADMGGSLRLDEPGAGEGACFVVELALAAAASGAHAAPERPAGRELRPDFATLQRMTP